MEFINMETTTPDFVYPEMASPCLDTEEWSLNSTALVIIYILVFCLSVLGNTVVIFVVFFMDNRRTSTDIYLMHLAVADLLFSFTLPFWAANTHAGTWLFGTVMCKLLSGMQEATFYCCVFLLACISVDRYLAIVKATQFLTRKQHLIGMVCGLVWLCAFLLSVPVLVSHEAFTYGDRDVCHANMTAEVMDDWRMGLRIVRHTLGFFAPLTVMIFCYGLTVCTLCRSRNSQKQKAMRVILIVVLAFIISWLPKNLTEFTDTLMRAEVLDESCQMRINLDIALEITQVFAFTHCAINPILYAFIGKKFRNQLLISLFKKGLLGRDMLSKYRVGSVHSSGSTRQMSVTM